MNATSAVASRINAKAALWAGLIAGSVSMLLEMILVPVFRGGSPWGPSRMVAAIGMGKEAFPPSPYSNMTILLAGLATHLALSVIFAFVFAFIARGRSVGTTVAPGVVFGLVVYMVNFYALTPWMTWFAMGRGWIAIVSHVVFGAVLGWVYASIAGGRSAAMTSS